VREHDFACVSLSVCPHQKGTKNRPGYLLLIESTLILHELNIALTYGKTDTGKIMFPHTINRSGEGA
jgi:hypothetical protein